jgi:hypothetical protein
VGLLGLPSSRRRSAVHGYPELSLELRLLLQELPVGVQDLLDVGDVEDVLQLRIGELVLVELGDGPQILWSTSFLAEASWVTFLSLIIFSTSSSLDMSLP